VGSIRSLQHRAQRPGGVRELSMAWYRVIVGGSEYSPRHGTEAWWGQGALHGTVHRGLVGRVNKVSTARCTEAWWGEGAVHGMAQLPCSVVEDP